MAHVGIRGCSCECVYLLARSPGLRQAKGPWVCGWCGGRGVLMQVPAGAGLLVPAGVLRTAGGCRGSPWPAPGHLVFVLEFDTMRVCAYQIMRMQTHVTKKHASECCVQLGVLAYLI